ncbi:M96 mating-specific protein family [Phytophthora cinnamomi]|uniref:M96 mating-specific protein family n=1 Tax=Phytophthora cinnamomi TaxID=4785 RepID=UPI00355A99A6|nr:M96 mating-specific protein family [Phytophthora cinnamomi]
MGPLAVQQSPSPRHKPRADDSTRSSPALPTMASPAVFPPLNLRSTSSGRMPHAAFPDSSDDAERRNATALTIVELLARGSSSNRNSNNNHSSTNSSQPQTLPALRPQSAGSSPLPSLPKMVIPSLRGDQRFAFPSSSGGVAQSYSTQTPTAAGVSPHGLSPAARPMPMPKHQPQPAAAKASAAAAQQASAAPAAAAPSPPKRGRAASGTGAVNNSRKRQKDELTRLRAQVQELQRELEHVRGRMPRKSRAVAVMMHKSDAARTSDHSPVAVTAAPLMGLESSSDAASGLLVVPVWERMAQHQKEEKSKAEMENLRLKGLIQEQLKISKGLEKLLRKRCKSSMSSGSDAETSAAVLGVKRPRTSDTEETAVFASLASGLDARLAEMEAVFEKGGLTRDKQELQETQMILDERRGPVMEVKDAKILPFNVQDCAAAIWQTLEAESEATVVGGTTSDTVCFKSSMPLRQHRAPDAELTVRCVLRRVVEETTGRVVFVWESVAECPNRLPHVSASAKGVEIRDCGWGLLEPLRTATGEHSSILQLCSYLMPQLCGVSAEQSRQHTHGLAELVVPCYRALWSQRQRSVENALMNGAIGAKHSHDSLKVELKQEVR